MCDNLVTCVQLMTNNNEPYAKVIYHMTTIVSRVSINQYQLTDERLFRRLVKNYVTTDLVV